MPPVILLTATVNVLSSQKTGQINAEERKQMYIRVIRRWLDETKLNITVIENSGYSFPEIEREQRLEIITFTENDIPLDRRNFLRRCVDKGNHELFAIGYALDHSEKLRNCHFFIKVTGRYFVPMLETIDIPLELEALAQSDPTRSEVLGCRRDKVGELFHFPSTDPHIEQTYEKRINKFKVAKRLPLISIPRTMMGYGTWIDTL